MQAPTLLDYWAGNTSSVISPAGDALLVFFVCTSTNSHAAGDVDSIGGSLGLTWTEQASSYSNGSGTYVIVYTATVPSSPPSGDIYISNYFKDTSHGFVFQITDHDPANPIVQTQPRSSKSGGLLVGTFANPVDPNNLTLAGLASSNAGGVDVIAKEGFVEAAQTTGNDLGQAQYNTSPGDTFGWSNTSDKNNVGIAVEIKAAPPPVTYTVSGTVTESDGTTAISGATVTWEMNDGTALDSGTTDANGEVTLSAEIADGDLPDDTLVTVDATGYTSQTKQVPVDTGSTSYGVGFSLSRSVDLSWTNPSDSDLAKIHIYRSTSPGFTPSESNRLDTLTGETAGANTSYTDNGSQNLAAPAGGLVYYYIVEAEDTVGNVSVSNEASQAV